MHVQIGSRIVLTCHVRASSGPPDYVFWYRGSDVLNYSPLVKIEDFYKRDQETTTVASSRGGDNAIPNENFIFDTVQFSKVWSLTNTFLSKEKAAGHSQLLSRNSLRVIGNHNK